VDHYEDEPSVPVGDAQAGGGATAEQESSEHDEVDPATSSGGVAGFGLWRDTPMRFTSVSGTVQDRETGRDAQSWRLEGRGHDPGWPA
jgi:hypothetical protein